MRLLCRTCAAIPLLVTVLSVECSVWERGTGAAVKLPRQQQAVAEARHLRCRADRNQGHAALSRLARAGNAVPAPTAFSVLLVALALAVPHRLERGVLLLRDH